MASSSNDCPQCFGIASSCGQLPACTTCQYQESCRYCADNPAPSGHGRDKRGHHWGLAVGLAKDVGLGDGA